MWMKIIDKHVTEKRTRIYRENTTFCKYEAKTSFQSIVVADKIAVNLILRHVQIRLG